MIEKVLVHFLKENRFGRYLDKDIAPEEYKTTESGLCLAKCIISLNPRDIYFDKDNKAWQISKKELDTREGIMNMYVFNNE
jgi:hypothetical protein